MLPSERKREHRRVCGGAGVTRERAVQFAERHDNVPVVRHRDSILRCEEADDPRHGECGVELGRKDAVRALDEAGNLPAAIGDNEVPLRPEGRCLGVAPTHQLVTAVRVLGGRRSGLGPRLGCRCLVGGRSPRILGILRNRPALRHNFHRRSRHERGAVALRIAGDPENSERSRA